MQTRTLAAASSLLLALVAMPLALRLAAAQWSTTADRGSINGPSTPAAAPVATTRVPAPTVAVATTAVPPELSCETRANLARTAGNPAARTEALAAILAEWAETDAGGALVWLDQHSELDQTQLVQAIGEGLAADPAAAPFALTYLAQDHELGALLTGALLHSLAAQGDSAAAVRLALAQPEDWSDEWTGIGFSALAYEDAAAALAALAEITDSAQRRATAAAIIDGWADRDPSELAQHAEVFDLPTERVAAREVALLVWQQRDPAAAAAFAAASSPRG